MEWTADYNAAHEREHLASPPTFAERRTTSQLSSAERSKVTDAMIDQIGALTKANNALNAKVDALAAVSEFHEERLAQIGRRIDELFASIDAIERGVAVVSAWVKRPFWERVRDRFGF